MATHSPVGQKPTFGGEQPEERIRITLTSQNVKALENGQIKITPPLYKIFF
jgi:hypothetical protein